MKLYLRATLLIITLICSPSFVHAEEAENAPFLLFTGNSNRELADKVAEHLGVSMGNATISAFNDGESRIKINDNVRNRDVFILQSNCATATRSVNENIMELYLMIRTMKRASAKSITVVIPYFGYARQDRKVDSRVPISAADIALLLEVAGANRIVAIDLHCGQIQGFFRHIPVDNLYASSAMAPYFASKQLQKPVVVSPDAGGVERAKRFQELLASYGVEAQLAMIVKQRAEAGVVEAMDLIGDVKDSDVILVDDLCDTGGTLVKAAQLLKDKGAIHVYTSITHPVFSGSALDKIAASPIDEMVITDTIPLKGEAPSNIITISMAPLLAEAIERIHSGESVSALFERH